MDDPELHSFVDCIFLDPTSIVGVLLEAMHNVNMYSIIFTFLFLFQIFLKYLAFV